MQYAEVRGAAALLLICAGCSYGPEPAGLPDNDGAVVRLDRDTFIVNLGGTFTLAATRTGAGGTPLPAPLRWFTRNARVATVDALGVVTGSGVGRTWIDVSDTRHLDSAFVTTRAEYSSIQAGTDVTCALTTVSRPLCWGWNAVGSLGDSTSFDAPTPVHVTGPATFYTLVMGAGTSCGTTPLGIYCWGYNGVGQIGDGTITNRRAPVRVADTLNLSRFVMGTGNTTCAFDVEGKTLCWGWNGWGQLLDGALHNSRRPIVLQAGRPLAAIATGGGHVCALDSLGTAWCWGRNDRGQLGDGTTTPRAAPAPVTGARAFRSIVAGIEHACGRTAAGPVWCWGDNRHNQLGGNAYEYSPAPIQSAQGIAFDTIATSAWHTCGLSAGLARCWGENASGQLGNGAAGGTSFTATTVAGGLSFRSISPGLNHSCGITLDRAAWCWGGNRYGNLGDGTQIDRAAPVRVAFQP